ncbi:SDR family oxidoreductase [Skermania sp. ID1734]|uniref:SDR family oxidoreductase n=1 Tax=Skermania sp. ID1734 TaxID=2597516 RepID=UPI00117DF2D9|nr:SDR family oxidoreductase [Skermania sp. ID1734]TSD99656.1 SDR family oxidoreductase [Skermania sp. ID1734]
MTQKFRRNILITGASSGLGEGMARLFAAKGHNLVLCARRVENLETIAKQLHERHPDITVLVRQLDVNDHDAVFRVFAETNSELGGLDRIIANAGLGKGQPIGTGYFAANKQTAETNFIGLLAQCEAAMQIFRERNDGHLVVVASVSAVRGAGGNLTTYAASKAAAAHLAEGIRLSVLGTPIKVTTLLPGYIESEMTARAGNTPLLTSAEKGHRAMVDAIEKEPASAYVPNLPWLPLAQVLKVSPLPVLKRLL